MMTFKLCPSKVSPFTQMTWRALLTVTCLLSILLSATSQGLNPPGVLGVSPAEAEKCDEHLADDFQALTRAANKLSTRADVMSMRVLDAPEGLQTKPGTSNCATSWDVLKNQLHVALAPAVYSTPMQSVTPFARNYLPYVRAQGICNTCVGQVRKLRKCQGTLLLLLQQQHASIAPFGQIQPPHASCHVTKLRIIVEWRAHHRN
jgi:hypothetical protein